MNLFTSLKRLFGKRGNPKVAEAMAATKKWKRSREKFEKATMNVLERQINDTAGEPMMMILAAYEIAKRGNIEFLSAFILGDVSQAIAAVEGLCYAGCNGDDSAIEATSGAMNHSDSSVRLRLVKSLSMIADGTPGESGYSTTLGRKRARAIIESAANDTDSQVSRWSAHALRETEGIDGVRRGDGVLTYLGRQGADLMLGLIDPSYGRL